ncbi:MAG: aminotransferase class I/II-fold pyridoxal phosphate-dependent enzyme [Planctomycetota bacterium]
MDLFAERMNLIGTENAFKVGAEITKAEALAPGLKVVRLNIGEPDFDSPEVVNQAGIESIKKGNTHYGPPQGTPAFREAVAGQILRSRGITVNPNFVVPTAGAKPGIGFSLLAYVNPGDEVIYPSPGYPMYESWVRFVGAKPVPMTLQESNGFRMEASLLEKLITPKTKLIFICSPSNPTGGVLSEKQLREISEVIRKKCSENVRIFSDEIYEHIVFDGNKHISIASFPEMLSRTIISSGHSKSYAMTGWRLGYHILPSQRETETFNTLNINTISCLPPFVLEAGREALANAKAIDPLLKKMVASFEERRNYVVDALNAISGIHCTKPGGAFYVFPNVSEVVESLGIIKDYEKLPLEIQKKSSPATLLQRFALFKHGVATIDRRSFGTIGSEGQHYLRLSTATSMDLLKEGLKRLKTSTEDKNGWKAFFKEGKGSELV